MVSGSAPLTPLGEGINRRHMASPEICPHNIEEVEIVYRDRDIVAVNKPCGMAVHRCRGAAPKERFLLQTVRDMLGCWIYPVHRLDRPTSGLVVFALDPSSARNLSRQFAEKKVTKTYLAVVRGYVEAEGVISRPLAPDAYKKKKAPPVPAETAYLRLATGQLPYRAGPYSSGRYSLAKVIPVTGRMHQIRRHFKAISHPVIGDRIHGDREHNRIFCEHLGCERLLLAAVEIEFTHPASRRRMSLVGRLDRQYGRVLKTMGWLDTVPGSWLPEK